MTEDGGVKFGILGIWCILLTFLAVTGYLYLNGPDSESALVRDPTTQINNTAIINNYYCDSTPKTTPIPIEIEGPDNTTMTIYRFDPEVTPALWNGTRRESVGLPADGFKNPCCKHCTPTPTTTPVPEFPCPLRSGC